MYNFNVRSGRPECPVSMTLLLFMVAVLFLCVVNIAHGNFFLAAMNFFTCSVSAQLARDAQKAHIAAIHFQRILDVSGVLNV
jgi:hypothetical protein